MTETGSVSSVSASFTAFFCALLSVSCSMIVPPANECSPRTRTQPPVHVLAPGREAHEVVICVKTASVFSDVIRGAASDQLSSVQGAILAHRLLDFDELKAMLDEAKLAHAETGEDLPNRLDPTNSFEFDTGGQE